MMPKISVIMPMYNVEKYVGLAIETLLNQTFTDFEAIFVDDCSTDDTLNIAKSFDDPRIKIIRNKKNLGGPGPARNVGLECARCEYIYFYDSDDALLPGALELLYNTSIKSRADITVCTRYFFPEDNEFLTFDDADKFNIRDRGYVKPVSPNLKNRVLQEYCNWGTPTEVWLQLIKHDFLRKNNLKFRDIEIHQDGAFLVEELCATSNIFKFGEPFYVYRSRKGSQTHTNDEAFIGFERRMRSFMSMVELFGDVLSKALKRQGEQDDYFIDIVCNNIQSRALVHSTAKFYVSSPKECWEFINQEAIRRYGKNNPLVPFFRKMIYGYFMSTIASKSVSDENALFRRNISMIRDFVNKVASLKFESPFTK